MQDTPNELSTPLQYAVRVQSAAVLIALIAAGSYIAIPLPGSPVPVVLQNMFVILTGMVLPPLLATGTVGVWLLLGVAGLPVFAGGSGGFGHLLGPTGGFLTAYLVAPAVTSLLLRTLPGRGKRPFLLSQRPRLVLIPAVVAGFGVVYLGGIPWLRHILQVSWPQAFAAGMVPFLVGDLLKILVLVSLVGSVPESVWRNWS